MFLEENINAVRERVASAAKAAGYTLSEDELTQIDATIQNQKAYATLYGYANLNDYLKAMYDLYPEIRDKGNEQNMAEAMRYMDLICNYDPLYITSSFNSGELIISYLLFAKNRLEDIRDSLRI